MSFQVLLIADVSPGASLIQELLSAAGKGQFQLERADRLASGLQRLAQGGVDLVLVDLALPDSQGLETWVAVQAQAPQAPAVVLCDLEHEGQAIEAVQRGAQDYVLKRHVAEAKGELLLRVMRHAIQQARAQEALRQCRAQLEKLARERRAESTARRRVQASLQRRNRELALLNLVSQALNSMLDIDRVLATVLDAARHLMDAVLCSIWLCDAKTGELVCQQAVGPQGEILRGWRLAPGVGSAGWVASHGKSLIVPDVQSDERHFQDVEQQIELGLHSLLSVPLQVKEKIIGVLQVADAQIARFDSTDLELLEPLAASAVVAVENARLYQQAQQEIAERARIEEALKRRNAELTALNAIATTISQSPDLDNLLEATLDQVLALTDMDGGGIQLLDESAASLALVAHRGLRREALRKLQSIPLGEGLTGQVARSGQPSVSLIGPGQAEFAPTEEQALACVPFRSRDKVLGVLHVFSSRQPGPRQVQLLTAIAHQLGMAVENARLTRQAAQAGILHEVNRLRSELIANVSHELRTPLGLIKVSCNLLTEDVELDEDVRREFLYNIEDEVDKLETIVSNLLNLSRLESGQLLLNKRPKNLYQLAQAVITSMQAQSDQHRLVLDFNGPLVAWVDAQQIEQVLRNLLSNAIKYSPAGGTITIRGRQRQGQVLVCVSDEGIGISSREHERIFERFYRVESEIVQKIGGAGLGLSVCKGIVQAHAGRIWVESALGLGSKFYFTLPVLMESFPGTAQGGKT